MAIYAPPAWQADPANVKHIGVVVRGQFYVVEHKDPRGVPLRILESHPIDSMLEIAETAVTRQCGAVWVLDFGIQYMPETWRGDYLWHELSTKGGVAGYVVQFKGEDGAGKGAPICIHFVKMNEAWGLASYAHPEFNPQTFAEGVALAAFTLGQQLRFSPSYTGNAMMRRVLANYERHTGRAIPQPSPETRDLCMEHRPSPIQQRMWAIAGEGERITLHIYDRNMSYVSSTREVPVGDPIRVNRFVPHRPGLYNVIDLLHPYETRWVWEPELRAIIDNDPDADLWEVVEGYCWPRGDGGHILDMRLWSDRIWTARRAARAVDSVAGRIAESIIKKVGVSAVGRLIQHTGRAVVSEGQALLDESLILSYESDDAGELTGNVEVEARIGRDDLVWPHVWGTIISGANERLLHAVATYAPHDTVLMYVDQFYCLERHSELEGDPMKAGGWKYAGAFDVPASDLEALNALGAQELVKAFAKYQREQRNGK
jgi:hypothetical protein